MSSFQFTVDIEPQPATRPRFSSYSKSAYNTDKYVQFKNSLKYLLICAFKFHKIEKHFFEWAVDLEIVYFLSPPKNLLRKKTEPWRNKIHVSKPDIDNLDKAFLDAATGILFKDDAQVFRKYSEKKYDVKSHIEVKINYIK
jgi:Holliday junction resolvase RusA-like endonuclease